MKAILITETGDPGVLNIQDVPKPQPLRGEALIRIMRTGVNFVDIYFRTGRYVNPLPFVPGYEGAGIVEAVGPGVTEVKVGNRVAWAGQMGSYAEYCAVKASQLIPVPREFSFDQAAAFPLQGMTAHYLLHEFHKIKPGDAVLIHAAAGGMGLLLVQWLKHMRARVIGTVSSQEKANLARQAGADDIIIYTQQDFVAETMRLTGGKGANYIIDGVGKDTFSRDLEAVRTRGHITLYGAASGIAEPLAPNSLQKRSITVSGGTLFDFIDSRDELLRRAGDVLNGIRMGWLKLRIDHILPLEQAAEAHRLLEGRMTTGKVILKVAD